MTRKFEILENIDIVKQQDVHANQLMLNGISIGDSESLLDPDLTEPGWQVGSNSKWIKNKSGGRYRVTDGKVTEICIDDALAKKLSIHSAKEVIEAFGSTKLLDRRGGWYYFFYESRDVVVYWEERNKKLYGLFWGDTVKYPTFSRSDLLSNYFELLDWAPGPKTWSAASFSSNQPRFYQFKQLEALLEAFGIPKGEITTLSQGKFIESRPFEDYIEFIADIEAYKILTGSDKYKEYKMTFRDLTFIYNYLFEYRMVLDKTLRYNSGWLETGHIRAQYVVSRTANFINNENIKYVKYLDTLLCAALDPYKKEFKKFELIERYGYPDVDLEEIDSDNY